MKKVSILLVVVSIIIAMSSCLSTVPKDIPDWYLNPPITTDGFYGVGSAKLSKIDASRRQAIARAREDISFQLKTKVQSTLKDYFQESGVDDESQVITFVEQVSKQVANNTLEMSKPEKIAVGKDGTVYALISMTKSEFLNAAEKEFVRNESAAFGEFKATEALKMLEEDVTTIE